MHPDGHNHNVTKNPFWAEVWFSHRVLGPLGDWMERRYGKRVTLLFAILVVWPLARLWFRTRTRLASHFPTRS